MAVKVGQMSIYEKNVPDIILKYMKHLNMGILLFVSFLIAYCLGGYVDEHSSEEYLRMTREIPLEAWKICVLTIGLYVGLLILLSIKTEIKHWLYLKVVAELAICGLIFGVLHFSYSGTVLLVLANEMGSITKPRLRPMIILLAFASYVLLNYNVIELIFSGIVPIEAVFIYMQSSAVSLTMAVIEALKIINTFLFISYLLLLVWRYSGRTKLVLHLNDKLAEKNRQLIQLNEELEEATKTKERNRLAREIHDTLGHTLTGIITGADACAMIIDIAPEVAKQQLSAISDIARGGIKDVRRSVHALRPDVLEKEDLYEALQQMIETTRKSTGVKIDFACVAALDCFNQDEEDIIYRIVQEGTTNAIRHGKASEIKIKIERNFDTLWIEIKDNGIGCTDVKKGFGIHHMEERLKMLNGTLKYDGRDGFKIQAEIPIRWGK